jgi:hypothetical protein
MQPPRSTQEVWDRLHTWFVVWDPQAVEVHSDLSVSVWDDLEAQTGSTAPMGKLPLTFREVTGNCMFSSMGLTSLLGSPKKCGGFFCSGNRLISLVGGPTEVTANYSCSYNQLVDLRGAPNTVPGWFVCMENPFESLEGCPKSIGEKITVTYKHDLPLLRTLAAASIDIENTPDQFLERILNNYAGQGKRGAIRCQKELISAGFERNARW